MNADVLLDWIGQIRAERRMLRLIINKLLLRRKRKLRKIYTASEPFGVKRISPGQDRAHFLESNHSAHPAPILQDLTRHSVARCNLPAVLAYFPEEACLKQSGLITLAVLLIALPVYSQSSSDTGEAASPPAELSSPAPTASTPITKVEPGHPDKRIDYIFLSSPLARLAFAGQRAGSTLNVTLSGSDAFEFQSGLGLLIMSGSPNIAWTSSATPAAGDLFLTRCAAGCLQQGKPDAATAVAQTSGVQNVVAGTSNVAGATRILRD